jgi:hypothetical protein
MTTLIRPELEQLPNRMKNLAIDERGYPVPWFVAWRDGKPEFRAMDGEKWLQAIRFRKCWTCGERLGRRMTFVAGPMCGINRTSSEPPSHLECARWSARNCPFLNNPDAVRRYDEEVTPQEKIVGGFSISRNPGVTMLWTTSTYDVFPDGLGGRLCHMGEPQSVEWFHRGRPATREEIMRSVNTGIGVLENMARKEDGGLAYLAEQKERFMLWVPE